MNQLVDLLQVILVDNGKLFFFNFKINDKSFYLINYT